MTRKKQMSSLAIALVIALALAGLVLQPAFADGVALRHSHAADLARPPQQDPTPTPPPPPNPIIQNIFNSIQFPFDSLVEALQNAIQTLLRSALEPIQTMFEGVLSLWLQNPGILSSGNAALPGWDMIRDAWQFMYSIGVAFWPLTLAVIAAIAAKDAVAASTWGLGDLKQALGTWLVAVILCATSLWWMDLANQLANAITSYILYNFAGPQFFPGSFMVIFSTVLPALFLAFPLAGIIIIIFLLILAITIFVGLTFAIIARLVLVYLLVALGPIAIILGVLPPLRFVTHLWTRGFLLVLALGPVNALLLKLAFNVAQYAASAPVVQGAAAFIGVFGLLSVLITINFAVVKGVFGAVIAVAQQTMAAVKTVGQMVVAGALLVSGAGSGAALGGAAGASAAGGAGGGSGSGGSGGAALGGDGVNGNGIAQTKGSGMPVTAPNGVGGNASGRTNWQPNARGMAAAGSYLQGTRGPLAGFGALLRAAGIEQLSQERGALHGDDNDAANTAQPIGLGTRTSAQSEGDTGSGQLERGRALGERGDSGTLGGSGVAGAVSGVSLSQLGAQNMSPQIAGRRQRPNGGSAIGAATGANRAPGQVTSTNAPPRRANLDSIPQSRAAMGFDRVATDGQPGTAQSGGIPNGQTPVNPLQDTSTQSASSSPAQGGLSSVVGAQASGASTAVSSRDGSFDVASENGGALGFGDRLAAPNDFGDGATASAPGAINVLAPEADRTLSMLPAGSDAARAQAEQLVHQYKPAEQGNVAAALEHAMRTANEQHGIGWSNMGGAVEHGLWSTLEAAQNGIPLQEMARQLESFSGTRDPGEYLAWQLARGGESFHLPAQQVPYLPAPGPYDYQAGRYVEQQLGSALSYRDAAQMFYVLRDPAAPGGGWSKGHQFIGEVNRIAQMPDGDAMQELDRWMQTNAPTRARMLWNIHFQLAKGGAA